MSSAARFESVAESTHRGQAGIHQGHLAIFEPLLQRLFIRRRQPEFLVQISVHLIDHHLLLRTDHLFHLRVFQHGRKAGERIRGWLRGRRGGEGWRRRIGRRARWLRALSLLLLFLLDGDQPSRGFILFLAQLLQLFRERGLLLLQRQNLLLHPGKPMRFVNPRTGRNRAADRSRRHKHCLCSCHGDG